MKLQISMVKKFQSQTLIILIQHSALKKDENYSPQVFLKECKYIEKNVVRYNDDNLSDFSYSGEFDEEQIRAFRFIIFEITIYKFLRDQF